MTNLNKLIIFLILFFTSFSSIYANNSNKANTFLQELYENCPEFLEPGLAESIEEIISRVSIIESNESNLPLISSFSIKSKCLSNINLLDNFDPNTFNYYLYFINFESDQLQKIRIDNTNYIMIIQPYNK